MSEGTLCRCQRVHCSLTIADGHQPVLEVQRHKCSKLSLTSFDWGTCQLARWPGDHVGRASLFEAEAKSEEEEEEEEEEELGLLPLHLPYVQLAWPYSLGSGKSPDMSC